MNVSISAYFNLALPESIRDRFSLPMRIRGQTDNKAPRTYLQRYACLATVASPLTRS